MNLLGKTFADKETKMMNELPKNKIFIMNEPPKPVGCWELNKYVRFYVPFKPNIIHRFFTKLLLGWEWIEE